MTITLDTVDIVILIAYLVILTSGFIWAFWNWQKSLEKFYGGVTFSDKGE